MLATDTSLFLILQACYAASKILSIVEAEVEERYKCTRGSKRTALEPNSMRRLHRANLPMEDSQRATEIISKLTSIDNSKLRFQKVGIELVHSIFGGVNLTVLKIMHLISSPPSN